MQFKNKIKQAQKQTKHNLLKMNFRETICIQKKENHTTVDMKDI